MPYQDHKLQAGTRSIACAIITCSDTRTPAEDESGHLIRTLLESHGHTHPVYQLIKDEPAQIRSLLNDLATRPEIQCIIINGGTGISRRDNTFDAVAASLTKTLPGFGELFRMLSYQTIGSGAMLSRATAGIIVTPTPHDSNLKTQDSVGGARHTVVFSIPGSPNAVELAMTRLILPELPHLVWETTR